MTVTYIQGAPGGIYRTLGYDSGQLYGQENLYYSFVEAFVGCLSVSCIIINIFVRKLQVTEQLLNFF